MAQFASNVLFSIDTAIQQKNGVNDELITVNKTLTYQDSSVQILKNSTAGSLNVVLPAYKSGTAFWIANRSSSTSQISVQQPGGAGGVVTLAASGEASYIVCDGSTWTALFKSS
tara:strand:- start:208 stop:549 length:342 start_codon:yes stop_codon:yes gene_type:complete